MKKIILFIGIIFAISTIAYTQGDENIFYDKIHSLVKSDNTRQAIRLLKKRISEDKTNYIAMIELGNVYVDMGKKKHAFKLYKKAVKINPDYPDSHFFLGRLYFQMQKFENITSEFDIFRAKTRSFSELDDTEKNVYIKKLYYIGDVYFNLKKYPNMKLIVDEILKINPNDQYGYYNLGVYYYMYKRSRSKAYEIFQKVIDINPHSEAARDARYAIEFMRNNPDPRLTPDFSFIDRLDEEY